MNDAKNIIKNLSTEEANELASIELDEALDQMQNLVKNDFFLPYKFCYVRPCCGGFPDSRLFRLCCTLLVQ